jgi:hypothetical protein
MFAFCMGVSYSTFFSATVVLTLSIEALDAAFSIGFLQMMLLNFLSMVVLVCMKLHNLSLIEIVIFIFITL